ncbi:bax inhibitor 1, putative, partial [Plasmodium reichenowi]
MADTNGRNSVVGQNYGAAYNQGGYNYSQNKDKENYEKSNSGQKGYYYDARTNITANGGLYDEFSLNEFSSTKIRHG